MCMLMRTSRCAALASLLGIKVDAGGCPLRLFSEKNVGT